MTGKQSAGILVYRRRSDDQIEVLLLHLAGPLWAKKDKWHFPKGQLEEGEDALTAAKREFHEEVGIPVPDSELIDLGEAKQGPKTNRIWAIENDVDLSKFPSTIESNTFEMEWPPHSGHTQTFPENDRAQWFPMTQARDKVFAGLVVFFERLAEHLGQTQTETPSPPTQQSLL